MNNSQNRLITTTEIEDILNYFGNIGNDNERLHVNNRSLYQKAFVHESFMETCSDICVSELFTPDESYERLEYLGDNTLKFIMGKYLYSRFPNEREHFLTDIKIKLEQTKMLHIFARQLQFSKWLLLSEEVESHTILSPSSGRNTKSFYEDAFEAFIGSLVLDNGEFGVVYASRFVTLVIENIVDFGKLITTNDNHKDSIQRFFQSNKWKTPEYNQITDSGPGYRKLFTRVLFIERKLLDPDSDVYDKIKKYSLNVLHSYKTDPVVYKRLFSKITSGITETPTGLCRDCSCTLPPKTRKSGEHYFVLGIGTASKGVDSEQICAKEALVNFGLALDY